jgi:thiopurine S-methyltransferase
MVSMMDREFWLNRWEKNDIGFHKDEPHFCLLRRYASLQSPEGAYLFVPLCDKSKDLVWLCERGHNVVGVELSRIAFAACSFSGCPAKMF